MKKEMENIYCMITPDVGTLQYSYCNYTTTKKNVF